MVALNYSATLVNMKNIPSLLGIEAKRRNKKNTSKSLLTIASTSQPPKNETPKNDKKNFSKNFKGKGKNFKNNDKNKRGKGKFFKCGKIGHYQADFRENKNNNKPNYGGSKDIICVVFESLLIDVDSGAWWVGSASSRHVAKTRDFFVDMKEIKAGDHRVYMDNNTY